MFHLFIWDNKQAMKALKHEFIVNILDSQGDVSKVSVVYKWEFYMSCSMGNTCKYTIYN